MSTLLKRTDRGFETGGIPNPPTGVDFAEEDFFIVPFRDGARPCHALIAKPGTAIGVNGFSVVGGIRVLQHKDELMIGSQQMFFSAESFPVVEVYQHDGTARRPRCPVCRAEIRDSQTVVRCPGCARVHHQLEEQGDSPAKPCWTYASTCRFCDHPTSLSGEPQWRPDEDDRG